MAIAPNPRVRQMERENAALREQLTGRDRIIARLESEVAALRKVEDEELPASATSRYDALLREHQACQAAAEALRVDQGALAELTSVLRAVGGQPGSAARDAERRAGEVGAQLGAMGDRLGSLLSALAKEEAAVAQEMLSAHQHVSGIADSIVDIPANPPSERPTPVPTAAPTQRPRTRPPRSTPAATAVPNVAGAPRTPAPRTPPAPAVGTPQPTSSEERTPASEGPQGPVSASGAESATPPEGSRSAWERFKSALGGSDGDDDGGASVERDGATATQPPERSIGPTPAELSLGPAPAPSQVPS